MSSQDESSKWGAVDAHYLVGLKRVFERRQKRQQLQKTLSLVGLVLILGSSATATWLSSGGFSTSSTAFTCADLQQNMKSYLEGKLDEPARLRFEEHLKTCERCQEVVNNLRVGTNPRLGTIASLPVDSDESLLAVGY